MSNKRKADEIEDGLDIDGEERPNRRARITLNYSQLQVTMNTLSNNIREYSKKYQGKDETLLLTDIRNKIPVFVIYGGQSSGKTTLLKLLYQAGGIISNGTGTRCPVEIRVGPFYTNKIIAVNETGNKNFDSIVDAEKFIIENILESNRTSLFMGRIIQEIYNPDVSMTVIDLPGIKSNDQDSAYFQQVKVCYLDKAETTILNVMRGDSDPETDLSIKYIKDTTNDVITILTHTDIWKHDNTKFENIKLVYNMNHVKKIAVVNNKDDELDIINSFDFSGFTQVIQPGAPSGAKEIIKGRSNLKIYIERCLNNKIEKIKPELMKDCINVKGILNNELIKIGFNKPDMKEAVVYFRRDMTALIKKEFDEDHTEFSILANNIKSKLTSNNINSFIGIVPQEAELLNELKNGSRRKIQGSEGWNSVIVKYFKLMINEVKNNIISQFIGGYIEVVEATTNRLLRNYYQPSTMDIQHQSAEKSIQFLYELKDKMIDKLKSDLDMISMDPYVDNNQYFIEYLVDIYKPFAKKMKSELEMNPNQQNIDHLVKKVVLSMDNDPYITKARFAYSQLKNLWKVESESIYNQLITHVSNMDRQYEAELENIIQRVEYTDLHEPPETEERRVNLKGLIKNCEDIIELIRQ